MAAVYEREPGNNMGRERINFGETIFFLLLFLLAAFVLLVSPLFAIREIVVAGNQELSAEKIVASSGLTTGVNIFQVNLSQAATGIKKLPMVKEVSISRDFPSRITIRIRERRPVALLPAKEGFIAVDLDGVYCRNALVGEKGLPVITGIPVTLPPVGHPVVSKKLRLVLEAINNLPAGLVVNLSEVNLDQSGQLVIYTLQGTRCHLGYPDEISRKGMILMQVLNELKDKQIEYIDLSLSTSPVVKLKS